MILAEADRLTVTGERILKIASSFMYTEEQTPVYELLAEIGEACQNAVAVVDRELKVTGIIVPRELVEVLGKPFGRDLLKRQSVEAIMQQAVVFPYDAWIQDIRERIAGDLESGSLGHYVLAGPEGQFCGLVSAQDILVHAMSEQQRELETAVTIQNRLVPPCFAVRSEGVSITCSSVMAQGVGGDYYYAREYLPGRWFFCLCDISGKGISAAIITAVLAGFMFSADFRIPLEETIRKLNSLILGTFKLEKYLTGFFARFNQKTGELEYCDMGHSFFYVVENASVQQIADTADNVPVGLIEQSEPVVRTLRLAPDMVLMVVSDGMTEQENSAGELFDMQTAGQQIYRSIMAGEDLVTAKIRILEHFYTFRKDIPQHDDLSMLLFRYTAGLSATVQ
jgi:sigma-B regulation protein RsbU (phosphoserine phosphatase)